MIWWIIFAITMLIIIVLITTIAIGIRVSFYFDYLTLSGCADIYIFNSLLIFKLRFFECDKNLFIQINKKSLKTITLSQKSNVKVPKFPVIYLSKLHINCAFGTGDLASLGRVFGLINASLPYIDLLLHNNIRVKDKKIRAYPIYDSVNWRINSQIVIKFSIFKIMFFILHIIIKKYLAKLSFNGKHTKQPKQQGEL